MTGSPTLSARVKEPSPNAEVQITQEEVKQVLALPDLERAKTAVLNSLTSARGQRTTSTRFASSSPGTARSRVSHSTAPSFSAIASTLEQRHHVPATINARTGKDRF
jgi:hypothetical protein